jgi:hypothetical protein
MTQLIGLKSPAPTIPPPRLIIRKSTQHLSGPRVSG